MHSRALNLIQAVPQASDWVQSGTMTLSIKPTSCPEPNAMLAMVFRSLCVFEQGVSMPEVYELLPVFISLPLPVLLAMPDVSTRVAHNPIQPI